MFDLERTPEDISQFDFDSIGDIGGLMDAGRILVEALLARYARVQHFVESPEDQKVYLLLDLWLEKAISLADSTFVALIEKDVLTPTEIYVILILYVHHTFLYIRNACVHLNIHDVGGSITISAILDMLYSTFVQSNLKLNVYSIKSFCLNSTLLIRKPSNTSNEVEIYLTQSLLHRLNGYELSFDSLSYYYHVEQSSAVEFVPDLAEEQIADLCLRAFRQRLCLVNLVYGMPGIGKRTLVQWLANKLSLPLIILHTDCLVHATLHNLKTTFNEIMSRHALVLLPSVDSIFKNSNFGLTVLEAIQSC